MSDPDHNIETAESLLRELLEACESVAVYPEGAVGFENLAEVEEKVRRFLAERDDHA